MLVLHGIHEFVKYCVASSPFIIFVFSLKMFVVLSSFNYQFFSAKIDGQTTINVSCCGNEFYNDEHIRVCRGGVKIVIVRSNSS